MLQHESESIETTFETFIRNCGCLAEICSFANLPDLAERVLGVAREGRNSLARIAVIADRLTPAAEFMRALCGQPLLSDEPLEPRPPITRVMFSRSRELENVQEYPRQSNPDATHDVLANIAASGATECLITVSDHPKTRGWEFVVIRSAGTVDKIGPAEWTAVQACDAVIWLVTAETALVGASTERLLSSLPDKLASTLTVVCVSSPGSASSDLQWAEIQTELSAATAQRAPHAHFAEMRVLEESIASQIRAHLTSVVRPQLSSRLETHRGELGELAGTAALTADLFARLLALPGTEAQHAVDLLESDVNALRELTSDLRNHRLQCYEAVERLASSAAEGLSLAAVSAGRKVLDATLITTQQTKDHNAREASGRAVIGGALNAGKEMVLTRAASAAIEQRAAISIARSEMQQLWALVDVRLSELREGILGSELAERWSGSTRDESASENDLSLVPQKDTLVQNVNSRLSASIELASGSYSPGMMSGIRSFYVQALVDFVTKSWTDIGPDKVLADSLRVTAAEELLNPMAAREQPLTELAEELARRVANLQLRRVAGLREGNLRNSLARCFETHRDRAYAIAQSYAPALALTHSGGTL